MSSAQDANFFLYIIRIICEMKRMPTKTAFASFRKTGATKRKLEEVAALFGVNKATIIRWENGEVPLPAKRLKEFEDVTGIPRQQLRPDLFEGMEA
jgi:transcriptional regulator with XRE-family HTH domain